MSHKRQNPALARRAPEGVRFGRQDTSDSTSRLLDLQTHRLATRFPISLSVARVVAEIYYAGRAA